MSGFVDDSLATFNRVSLSLNEIAHLYSLMVDSSDVVRIPGAYLRFFDLWNTSIVYEIPCGYLRFEEYPLLNCATVHGIFTSNPFYHTNLIKEVLDFYLDNRLGIDRLECHVNNRFKGVQKLVSSFIDVSVEDGDKIVYQYWR